jgi:hypothetical protein
MRALVRIQAYMLPDSPAFACWLPCILPKHVVLNANVCVLFSIRKLKVAYVLVGDEATDWGHAAAAASAVSNGTVLLSWQQHTP